ncbi:hypothetical protein GT350_03825 [Streptomyces sp. SID1034]|nr:hypothetical protein [Streptomyces sp. SID1034]
MYAITIPEPGGPEALIWAEVPDPVPGGGGVGGHHQAPCQARRDVEAPGAHVADRVAQQAEVQGRPVHETVHVRGPGRSHPLVGADEDQQAHVVLAQLPGQRRVRGLRQLGRGGEQQVRRELRGGPRGVGDGRIAEDARDRLQGMQHPFEPVAVDVLADRQGNGEAPRGLGCRKGHALLLLVRGGAPGRWRAARPERGGPPSCACPGVPVRVGRPSPGAQGRWRER